MGATSQSTFTFILGLFVILFALELIFGSNAFNLLQKRKYLFRNLFPFELAQGAKRWFVPFHYIFVGGISLSMMAFGYFYFDKLAAMNEISNVTQIIGSILWVIIGVTQFLLFVLTLKYPRLRLVVMGINVIAVIGVSSLLGTHYFNLFGGNHYSGLTAIITYIPAFVTIILIVNPNLYKYTIVDKRIRQDGVLDITRPNNYAPAYTEWLVILVNAALFIIINIINLVYF